ncbi:protein deglycase DJ-1 [Kipferlia bialata]|uniref:Protein deglycase DJ-1 n=1 Tax=Kipferlia bialata TaxID=797122 RepID=A0A9K3CMX2_9EUKA|nr:protein deglycase DJ-1 [Kipferlia bialata]|eukprot:g790.t1
MVSVLIGLGDGFEEIEAFAAIDILRRAKFNVTIAGVTETVTSARDITIRCDCTLDEALGRSFDAVAFPGGMGQAKAIHTSAPARALAEKALSRDKVLAGICATPGVALAPWGVMRGRKATCYPGCEGTFAAGGVEYVTETVVVDRTQGKGTLVTSRGPGTAMAWAYAVVSAIEGSEAHADQLKKGMLF